MSYYLIKKHKLVFVYNAKCACSTIKNIINQIDKLYNIRHFMDVHKYKFENTTANEVLNKYPDYNVIFFCRNPYNRAISAYSKITNKLILGMRFINNKTQQECNKLTNNGNISFNDWIKLITSIKHSDIDGHFKPQITTNTKCFINYINKTFRY